MDGSSNPHPAESTSAGNRGCPRCPVTGFARPVTVVHRSCGSWAEAGPDRRVDLVALFRDPGISKKRHVETVLDIVFRGGRARNRTHCWTLEFVQALECLPLGLTVALENGVRCPCPRRNGIDEYRRRLKKCWVETRSWLQSLRSRKGPVPLLLCDKDLIESLASTGILETEAGKPWRSPRPFVGAVGRGVRVEGRPALVLAHPIVVKRYPTRYGSAVKEVVAAIDALAKTGRLGGDTG